MTAYAIELEGVSKSFTIPDASSDTVRATVTRPFRRPPKRRLHVLDDVTLRVRSGETLAIMGRNGGGKSTLLKLISGIYVPDEGAIRRSGSLTPILELGLGWNPELNAIDNIYLLASVMGMPLREIDGAIGEILEFAELSEFARLQLKYYSTGMGARLAYSVAFRAVGEILVLDEIFAVGDSGFRQRCLARYDELRRAGHTIVVVSHSSRDVERLASRGILLEDGKIVRDGPSQEIAEAYEASFA